MINQKQKQIYYKALLDKNTEYEGLFYVGVKTTGVFCRPTCSARKPKFENCDFFKTAKAAVISGFRPCQRCKPLSLPNSYNPTINKLLAAIEEKPEYRWKTIDLKNLGINDSTARRQFQKKFGMTFLEYARMRRMGIALHNIKQGNKVIDTQLDAGYESDSGFRDAFTRIMGVVPSNSKKTAIVKASWLDTELGLMLIIADDMGLYLLEFADRRGLELEITRFRNKQKIVIIPGETKITRKIKKELNDYFSGKSLQFTTPLHMLGSDFQKQVWHELQKIPISKTCSYLDIAKKINHPTACRAVARANGANQLAIIIPCHRVINSNNELGGYGGGISRKKWLLDHERNHQ